MANDFSNVDSMEYSGQKAINVQNTIIEKLEAAETAYTNAFDTWAKVAEKFTLGSQDNTTSLFDGVKGVSKAELDKTRGELEELAKGLNNINQSWVDLNTSISSTLSQYGQNSTGSNNGQ